MPNPTDQNDPQYRGNPNYVFVNGRWQYRSNPAGANQPDKSYSLGAADFSNPDSAYFKGKPDQFVFQNGRWYYKTAQGPVLANESNTNMGANEPLSVRARQTGAADPFGRMSAGVPEGAPGSELDTGASSADRGQLVDYLGRLRSEAATGNGDWQNQLNQSTVNAVNGGLSLAASNRGINPAEARREASNAGVAAMQTQAGLEPVLRQQHQQESTAQLASILGQQGSLDAQEAAQVAAARQGRREADLALQQANQQAGNNFTSGLVQTMGTVAALSEGGRVPGQAREFGDSERNDTVPAWLSPGEVVIPRSIANSPNAPERAAEFVRSVKSRPAEKKHHFDDGGKVPFDPTATNESGDLTANPLAIFGGPAQEHASIENGALLDTSKYDTNRAELTNLANSQRRLMEQGDFGAVRELQQGNEASVLGAQRALSRGRGSPGLTAELANEQGQIGERAARQAGRTELERGRDFATAVQGVRAQDMALALAKQQAAWKNSMSNLGLGLQQQSQLTNLLAGAGQGLASASGTFDRLGRNDESGWLHDYRGESAGNDTGEIDRAFDGPRGAGDFNIDEGGRAARGGVVRGEKAKAASFLAALRKRAS